MAPEVIPGSHTRNSYPEVVPEVITGNGTGSHSRKWYRNSYPEGVPEVIPGCGPGSHDRMWSGMSKRGGGGGIATVTRGLCDAYSSIMIEGLKTYKPEVKASKSDKRLPCVHNQGPKQVVAALTGGDSNILA